MTPVKFSFEDYILKKEGFYFSVSK
jgi:hypothetical protein